MERYKTKFQEITEISRTIYNQIGKHAFYMMGAKNFIKSEKALSWKIMRNSKGVIYIKVILNSMDTYDIEFLNNRGIIINKIENIYNNQLHTTIEEHTGLNLSL